MLTNKQYNNLWSVLLVTIFPLWLSACTPEQTIRGVPETTWQQLTPEQKDLIIEQSYQHDIGNTTH
jgi:hypothetical protein